MPEMRRAACVILLRQSSRGPYELYLPRRSATLSFLGGYHAFPGGSLEPVDELLDAREPLRITALRELFEELGVLAARGEVAFAKSWRERVVAEPDAFAKLLREENLELDVAELIPMGRWQTPPYTPVQFDALYYALWLPEGQEPEIWPGELTEGEWLTPDEAITGHQEGRLFITYPVLETLVTLRRFDSDLAGAARAMQERGEKPYPHTAGAMLRGVYIAPGRTPTLAPHTHTNTYILGGRELVVVDPATPYDEDQDALVAFLRSLEREGGRLTAIWLTHHHRDHIGAVERVRRDFGVPVYAHALAKEALDGVLVVDHTFEDGDETTLALDDTRTVTWRAMHCPGHTRGHLCYYDPALGTLLSGDLVLGFGTVLVAPPEGDMAAYMKSLARLQGMKLGFIFPAHGPPIAAAQHKLREYVAHRTMRENAILAAIAETARTPSDIVPHVYSDIAPAAYPLAELNVRAHLDKLCAEGRVRTRGDAYISSSAPIAHLGAKE